MARTERARRLAEIEAAAQRFKALTEFEEPEVAEVGIDPDTMDLIRKIAGPNRVRDNDDHEVNQRFPFWNAG